METKNKFIPTPLPERYKQRDGQADYKKYVKHPVSADKRVTGICLLPGGWAIATY